MAMVIFAIVAMGNVVWLTFRATTIGSSSSSEPSLWWYERAPPPPPFQIHRPPRNHRNITAAICHPTLHDEPDLERVLHFCFYYKKLGFDHLFLWYLPHIANLPLFHELSALPYVTMTMFNQTEQDPVYFGQGTVEKECMSVLARNYTWTLVIDADEYLWFAEKMDVKEFLEKHVNYTYLSFGKWMYTPRFKVAPKAEPLFGGLNYYAFTGQSYCYTGGADVCPTWTGRCKVMARPNVYDSIGVHGDPNDGKHGAMQFHTATAHLKEWATLLAYPLQNSTVRASEAFLASEETAPDLRMHWLPVAYKNNPNGTVTIHYDDQLQDWFQFVDNLED
jgi:Glycosyltransferase family 92